MKSTLHTDKTLCGSDTYLSYFPRIRCHADMKPVFYFYPHGVQCLPMLLLLDHPWNCNGVSRFSE